MYKYYTIKMENKTISKQTRICYYLFYILTNLKLKKDTAPGRTIVVKIFT